MILHIYTNKNEKLDEFNDIDINIIETATNIGQIITNEQDISYVDSILVDIDSLNVGNKEIAESLELASRLLSADIFIFSADKIDAELFENKVCEAFERERINDIVSKIRERFIQNFKHKYNEIQTEDLQASEKEELEEKQSEETVAESLSTDNTMSENINYNNTYSEKSIEKVEKKPKTVVKKKESDNSKSLKNLIKNIRVPNISFNLTNQNKKPVTVLPKEKLSWKITRSISIGVAGIQEHIGVTHTALSMAKFLSEKGFKVCYVCEVINEDIKNIAEYDVRIKQNNEMFKIDKLDIYSGKIEMRKLMEYQFLIYDLGAIGLLSEKDFFSKDLRIIVSGCRGHELAKYNEVYKSIAYISNNVTLFNFSDVKIRKELKSLYEGTVVDFLEFSPDIFDTASNSEMYEKIIDNFIN